MLLLDLWMLHYSVWHLLDGSCGTQAYVFLFTTATKLLSQEDHTSLTHESRNNMLFYAMRIDNSCQNLSDLA